MCYYLYLADYLKCNSDTDYHAACIYRVDILFFGKQDIGNTGAAESKGTTEDEWYRRYHFGVVSGDEAVCSRRCDAE